ncbi:HEPN-associated N-terminal domain-containing protein [Burkholderia sp. Tr-862]|uniref:HEPN-associated N-terminal domain-containing protein n=1 Tax=Burkholderia sp. Tr-862 TaxID=2608331 RepID=UPI0032B43B6C
MAAYCPPIPISHSAFINLPMSLDRVCSSCFSDHDLRAWVRNQDGPRGCCVCNKFDSPTAEFHKIVNRIEECLRRYYGRAVDQLGYCSAEGGYLGEHWDSWDMLAKVGLDFPRDYSGRLNSAIAGAMIDEPWCDFDVGALDLDHALWSSWESFCSTVKHERRFFFHASGRDDQDSFTPASLLSSIAHASEDLGLITEIPPGLGFWRARPDLQKGQRVGASNFGPPPAHLARQSNRMNPAGIPMLYLASSQATALKETRTEQAKVGRWRTARSIRILDLRRLPPVPGVFSDSARAPALTLKFLHDFADDIMKPVARDEQVHIDYLPSQVVTEFMRDHSFKAGALDGIAYRSTVHRGGWNLALFLGTIDLGLAKREWGPRRPLAFTFDKSMWATSA